MVIDTCYCFDNNRRLMTVKMDVSVRKVTPGKEMKQVMLIGDWKLKVAMCEDSEHR